MELNAKNLIKSKHTLNISNRDKIEITGATEVVSSTEKEIIAKLSDSFIFVFGTELRVSKLSPEDTLLIASGNISGIKYENRLTKKSFFGKVFK